MKNIRKIDLTELYSDASKLKSTIIRNNKPSVLTKEYEDYLKLSELFFSLTGKELSFNDLFIDIDYIGNIANKIVDRDLHNYYEFLSEYKELITGMFSNYNDIIQQANFNEFDYIYDIRRYSETEFFDIILGYFSTFGNKYVKSVKKVLDNNRIQFGVDCDVKYSGATCSLKTLGKNYVTSIYSGYTTASLQNIVHEFGHVYEYDNIIFPQSKRISVGSAYATELSSSFFTLNFLDYLKKNNIDSKTCDFLMLSLLLMSTSYKSIFNAMYEAKDVLLEDNLDVSIPYYDENGKKEYKIVPIADAVKYGFGNIFALHLQEIYESDRENFDKLFNNLLSSRNETTLSEKIENLGFSVEDFSSCEIIKPRILRLSSSIKGK